MPLALPTPPRAIARPPAPPTPPLAAARPPAPAPPTPLAMELTPPPPPPTLVPVLIAMSDTPPSFPPQTPHAAVISDSAESYGEDLVTDDERRYHYAYAMRLANVEGQLRAIVRWEPTIEPLTSLSLVDARRIERIAADRPQVLPRQEQPRYPYEDILEIIPMEGGEIRVLVDWVDTYEPLENISQEDVQRLLREHEVMHN
ncbi:hypothetical protein ON010_g18786 [Phytophthora cinnamomi]|nr:hypothetical protein ON010_g18786 [Phytophthora cinnamomi]